MWKRRPVTTVGSMRTKLACPTPARGTGGGPRPRTSPASARSVRPPLTTTLHAVAIRRLVPVDLEGDVGGGGHRPIRSSATVEHQPHRRRRSHRKMSGWPAISTANRPTAALSRSSQHSDSLRISVACWRSSMYRIQHERSRCRAGPFVMATQPCTQSSRTTSNCVGTTALTSSLTSRICERRVVASGFRRAPTKTVSGRSGIEISERWKSRGVGMHGQ